MAGSAEVGFYYSALAISQAFNFLPLIICGKPSTENGKVFLNDGKKLFLYSSASINRIGRNRNFRHNIYIFQLIISYLYGYTYNKAAEVLRITALAIVPIFISVVNDYFTLSIGKSYITLIRTASGLILSVALNLVLIPKYGAFGSAISFLTAHLLSNTILYWILVPGYFKLFNQAIKYPISLPKYLKLN